MGELWPASIVKSYRRKCCLFYLIFRPCILSLLSTCLFTLVHEGTFALEVLNDTTAFCLQLIPPLFCILLCFSRQSGLFLQLLVGGDFGWFPDPRLFGFLICLGLQLVDVEAAELGRYFGFSTLAERHSAFLVKDYKASNPLFCLLLNLAINLTIWFTNASDYH